MLFLVEVGLLYLVKFALASYDRMMDTLVSLRKRIDALNDDDFESLVMLTGRESLTALIFHGLLYQMNHDQSPGVLLAINLTVKNVMKARLEKDRLLPVTAPNFNEDPDPFHINDLPDVMLSEISSYLLFEDQLNFERVNRSVFIGSRSSSLPLHPMTASLLKKWILYRDKHQDSIHSHHRHFKSVEIDSDTICTYDEDDDCMILPPIPLSIPFIKKMHSITINSWRDDDLSKMLNALVLNQCDSLPNLKQLRVLPDEQAPDEIRHFDSALRLLMERCVNLEYFEFDQHLNEDIDLNDCEWVGTLKGIAFYVEDNGFEDYEAVYNSVHSQITDRLESLHLSHPRAVSAINCKLVNLQELCIHKNHDKSLNGEDFQFLLKQDLRSLKRLNLGSMALHEMVRDKGDIHPFIQWLRKVLETVEYLRCGCAVTYSLWILQIALNQISGEKRVLKIQLKDTSRWSYRFTTVGAMNAFTDALLQMIAVLNAKCCDWMLTIPELYAKDGNGVNLENAWSMLRKEKCCDLKVNGGLSQGPGLTRVDIILCKEGSQINPCQTEPWKMTCQYCSVV